MIVDKYSHEIIFNTRASYQTGYSSFEDESDY